MPQTTLSNGFNDMVTLRFACDLLNRARSVNYQLNRTFGPAAVITLNFLYENLRS